MIKRLLRFIRKLKPKKHDKNHPVIVDSTDPNVPQVNLTEQTTTSDHATEPSGSPVATVASTSTQLVLWRPPTVVVPPFSPTPLIHAFCGRVPSTLVQAAAALTLGFLPTIVTQLFLSPHFFSSFLRSSRLERDFMLQRLQEPANIAATLRRIFGEGFPNSQDNNTHEEVAHPAVPEIRYLATDPSLAHLAPMQKIPSGAYGPRQLLAPPNVVPKPQPGLINAPAAQEIRYLAADPAFAHLAPIQKIPPGAYAQRQPFVPLRDAAKQQMSQGNTAGIHCFPADPAFAHLALRQGIPPDAYIPRHPAILPAGVPPLAWSGKTVGTFEIGTPQVLHPDPRVPPKRVPHYPPGLGFPNEQFANIPATPFIPTHFLCANEPDRAQIPSDRFASAAATRGHSGGVKLEKCAPEYEYEDTDAADARYEKYTISANFINLQAGMYRYKLTRTVGRGANGTVWLGEGARDDGPPMDVAIKVINRKRFFSTWASDKELRQMSTGEGMKTLEQRLLEAGGWISGEFSAWLRITFENHPFLTPLIDCFSDKNNFYFVMRYYPENLRLRVSNKACPLQLWQIRLIAAELVLALEKLHSMRIVHHDLKLENVLVTPNGHVSLCDFGNVSTFPNDLTDEDWNGKTMHGKAGTDGYLAPEQFIGDSGHNYKADIYVFGLMILDLFMPDGDPWYYCVPGVDIDEDDGHLFEDHQPDPRQKPVMAKVYDKLAKDLLMRILEPNPAKRPGWDEIKGHPFFKDYLDWRRVLARDYSPCYRACNKKKASKAIVRPSCWIRQCRHTRAVNAIQKLFNATADQDQGISALQLHAPRGLGWVDRRHGTPCNGMVCCKCDFPDVMSMNNRM